MNPTNSAVTEGYKRFLIIENHESSATIEVYMSEVVRFLEYLEVKKLDFAEISTGELEQYLLFRSENDKLSSRTMSKIITVFRSFYSFVVSGKMRDDDPTELLPHNKNKKKLPEVIDYNGIEKILEQIDISTPIGQRDMALFELIYSCGLRVSEAAGLKVTDYYKKERRIIVTGKRDKQRMLPVGDVAIECLDVYISDARNILLGKNNNKYLFLSPKGEQMTREAIWYRLKQYSNKAGVYSKVHTLRHSFATHLLQNGADLRSVQELMGHSDIRTTEIYTHIDTDDLYAAFEKAHPDELNQ